MRCSVCLIHKGSPQDNNDILFNGMCSDCLSSMDYYYQSENRITHISIEEAEENDLSIIDFVDQDFIEPLVKKEIKNVRRAKLSRKQKKCNKELFG